MADTNPNDANNLNNLKVNVPESVRSGVYSNAVSVNVNSNEVVVDFGYLLPNTQHPEIEVVSRVNLNQTTAESFLSVLAGAMEDFKKKRASAQAQQASAPVNQDHSMPGAHAMPQASPMPPTPPMPPMPPMPPSPPSGPMAGGTHPIMPENA